MKRQKYQSIFRGSKSLPIEGPFLLRVEMMTKPNPSLPFRNRVIVYGYVVIVDGFGFITSGL